MQNKKREIKITKEGVIGLPFEVTDVFWMIMKVWFSTGLIILQGGTNSSKTYSVLQVLVLIAKTQKLRITCIGQDGPNMEVGVFRDFQTVVESSDIVDSWFVKKLDGKRYYEMDNGSFFEFKSYDDGQDARSGKRDITFFNEINGITSDIFYEVFDRTTMKTIVDYNPSGRFWVHDELIGMDDSILLISNFTHNRFCHPNIVKRLLGYRLTNKYRWRVYGMGLTGQVKGIVYPDMTFVKGKQARDMWPTDGQLRRLGYGSDYGFSNDPFTLVKCGMYQGVIYVRAQLYKTGLRISQFVDVLEDWAVDQYDVIAFDDSQAKEQAVVLREDEGYNVKAANRRGGSIASGIALLQGYPIVVWDDEEDNFRTEQENYKWLERGGRFTRKPIDAHNHYMDALRYWGLEFLSGYIEEDDYEGGHGAV